MCAFYPRLTLGYRNNSVTGYTVKAGAYIVLLSEKNVKEYTNILNIQ
jgi:hypothetical protein